MFTVTVLDDSPWDYCRSVAGEMDHHVDDGITIGEHVVRAQFLCYPNEPNKSLPAFQFGYSRAVWRRIAIDELKCLLRSVAPVREYTNN